MHRAKREGKLAVSFDLEGMDALNGDIGMVDVYYRLGVRQMLFAYNRNNKAGGGCHDEDIGLTPFGRDVIREMNRVGMLVDCSHCGHRTTMEAMEVSTAPVIFSHSNARRLCDHERNIRDDQIKGCAATGGVIAVTGVGRFLGPRGPVVEHVVEHIDYMVELVGPQHVGLGMDSVLQQKPAGRALPGQPRVLAGIAVPGQRLGLRRPRGLAAHHPGAARPRLRRGRRPRDPGGELPSRRQPSVEVTDERRQVRAPRRAPINRVDHLPLSGVAGERGRPAVEDAGRPGRISPRT